MIAIFSFILLYVISAFSFDEMKIVSEEALKSTKTISIGTFEPAEKFNSVESQDVYIKVVECMTDMIYKSVSEINGKKTINCLKNIK